MKPVPIYYSASVQVKEIYCTCNLVIAFYIICIFVSDVWLYIKKGFTLEIDKSWYDAVLFCFTVLSVRFGIKSCSLLYLWYSRDRKMLALLPFAICLLISQWHQNLNLVLFWEFNHPKLSWGRKEQNALLSRCNDTMNSKCYSGHFKNKIYFHQCFSCHRSPHAFQKQR